MPNIFKRFSKDNDAQPYQFPDALELIRLDQLEEERPPELPDLAEEDSPQPEQPEQTAPPEPEREEEQESDSEAAQAIRFAQIQAESIVEDARRQAEEIIQQAMEQARQEADAIREEAHAEGHREGYEIGMVQARHEAAQELEKQAAALQADVQRFLEKAGTALDRQMDQNINEMRDLAIAVAEKVVCISLRSSSEVISRMIQTAIDKRKRREWVHIYIAECDASRMGQVPASLSAALAAMSDRVRIIPMANDESGTCIIETPDEIVDASAATQMANIRSLLMDKPANAEPQNLFFNNF